MISRFFSNHIKLIILRHKKMNVDVARNSPSVGVVLRSTERVVFKDCLRLNFLTTNKEDDYEAFITGLKLVKKLQLPELYIFSDSKLVVNQVTSEYEAQRVKMLKYLVVVKPLLREF